MSHLVRLFPLLLLVLTSGVVMAEEELFQAKPFTDAGSFTPGIEGPVADLDGHVFAVNFAKQRTIGRIDASGQGTIFATLPGQSVGNGLRFDLEGRLYVADYIGHNVLRLDMATRDVTTFAHDPRMNQPNDLAITSKGVLYASDPNWKDQTGQIWRIDRDGLITLVAPDLGTTNGIEVGPNDETLYVNETVQRNVWAFRITPEGTLVEKRLLRQFPDHGFDGMRVDVAGNLYITRYGKGTVVVLSPSGEIVREIDVLGEKPSNLCFGGPDGRTVFVTEVEHQRLVSFRVDQPGLDWQRRHQFRKDSRLSQRRTPDALGSE